MTETPKGVIIRTVDKDGKEIDRVPKAAKGNVPHDDYFSGFEVGFQAVAGTLPLLPVTPARPVTLLNYTPFLMGVREGVRAAGGNVKG
jgi:hypothetical protein